MEKVKPLQKDISLKIPRELRFSPWRWNLPVTLWAQKALLDTLKCLAYKFFFGVADSNPRRRKS